MFKTILGALAGLTLVLSPAHAQSDHAAPAIWAMSDADNTVYLLGTVHLLHPDTEWRTAYLAEVLEEVEQVWFEADTFSEDAAAQMAQLVPQLALNASGTPLTDMLSEDAQANLAIIAQRLGLSAEQLGAGLDPLQPWFASLQIAVAEMQAAGFDPESGVETALRQQIEGQDKRLHFLETAEQQLRFLADMPLDIQLSNFELGLQQAVDNPDMLDDLVAAWAQGDMDQLNSLMNEDMREQTPELFDVLLVQRNRNWVPDIAAALAGDEDVLVAVGAGHMPGAEGVISLLQAQGIEVRRVQ